MLGKVVTVTVARKGDDHCMAPDCSDGKNYADVTFTGRLVRWDDEGEVVLDPAPEIPEAVSVRTWVWPMLHVAVV